MTFKRYIVLTGSKDLQQYVASCVDDWYGWNNEPRTQVCSPVTGKLYVAATKLHVYVLWHCDVDCMVETTASANSLLV